MSKKDKRLLRFLRTPPVKDFRWEEFLSLMEQLGFDHEEQSGGSSHSYFILRSDPEKVIDTYRPHPGGTLWSKQIQEISDKLRDWKLI